MSETTTPAPTGTNAIEAAAAALGDNPTPEAAPQVDPAASEGDEGFKSEESKRAVLADLHKERETRKKLQAKLDEIESASMTDVERAKKEAEEKVPAEVAERLRGYLTTLHDIDAEDAALYLTSNDPETLLKQAAGLAKRNAAPVTPKPDPTQGAQSALALNGDGLTEALARAVGAS